MFNLAVPFFIPVWRRLCVVVVAVIWGLFEVSTGAVFWGVIFLGMGFIAAWKFSTADWEAVAQEEDDLQ
ncbi:hypothetical protein [uncultured Litoreibacter sp.]|uniref:hypothetical protein n=1 Tax=uncultured Litoreibacter sp. TaxID=1392394 RepID=UPI00261EEB56|nr:hypothetical protein [uncultured Litoreibacter sp.]